MRKRAVQYGQDFLAEARRLFPPGGSIEGRPSFELFERTILQTATVAFANDFDGCQSELGVHGPIRMVMTADTRAFTKPTVFFAVLIDDDTVEIVDIIVDDDHGPDGWNADEGEAL